HLLIPPICCFQSVGFVPGQCYGYRLSFRALLAENLLIVAVMLAPHWRTDRCLSGVILTGAASPPFFSASRQSFPSHPILCLLSGLNCTRGSISLRSLPGK